jgi:hypothetical protein
MSIIPFIIFGIFCASLIFFLERRPDRRRSREVEKDGK